MENCPCPLNAAIPTIPAVDCPEDFGQIVKLILTRRGNVIAEDAAAAALLATYTPLLVAVDDTKIQITPKALEGLVIPAGTAITEGGDDNSTPYGRQIVVGASTIVVEGMLRGVNSAVIAAMRAFRCEDLSAAFVNEFGQIIYDVNSDDELIGFPIHAFFIGDKGNEGKNTQDKATVRFGMDAGWRDNAVFITPTDFDPRFDLDTAPSV